MMHREHRHGSYAFAGVIFLLIGVFFLLDKFNVFPGHIHIGDWWPLILVIIGVSHLMKQSNIFDFGGWILILLGCGFLFAEQNLYGITWHNLWHYWPVLLIFLGLSIMFGRSRPVVVHLHRGSRSCSTTVVEGELRERVVLGGIEKEIVSDDFQGGFVETVMGSAEIDLRRAKMKSDQAGLNVSAVMGNVEIRVPRDWQVDVSPHTVMGSVENKTGSANGGTPKKLLVNASTVLGSIEITY